MPFVVVGFAYAIACHWSSDRRVLKIVGPRVEVLDEAPPHSPWLA